MASTLIVPFALVVEAVNLHALRGCGMAGFEHHCVLQPKPWLLNSAANLWRVRQRSAGQQTPTKVDNNLSTMRVCDWLSHALWLMGLARATPMHHDCLLFQDDIIVGV